VSRTAKGEDALSELGSADSAVSVSGVFEFLIQYYDYHYIVDMYVPHLTVVSNYGDYQVVPFVGLVVYELSERRYCSKCFQPISVIDNICSSCRVASGLDYPPCKSEFSRSYCHRDHVLYLALFEDDVIKVGMSRKDRAFFRLIEQGAAFGLLFEHERDRTFVNTHHLEQQVSKDLSLPDRLVFEDKVRLFLDSSLNFSGAVDRLNELRGFLENDYGFNFLEMVDLRDEYSQLSECDVVDKEPSYLDGNIVGFRGSVAWMEMAGKVVLFDLNRLQGRKLLNVFG